MFFWLGEVANGLCSFLHDADRIAAKSYMPTDDDVIRARLRTLGVQEYRFIFDHGIFNQPIFTSCTHILPKGRTVGQEWRLYDVGGTRSSVGVVFKNH